MEAIKVILIVAVGLGMLVAGSMGLAKLATAYDCDKYKEATKRPTKMVGMSCFIQDKNGEWYAWQEFKFRGATKGE